ncbi:DUF4928 family protein [Wenzhouxiangella sp. EGI_FJ10305]|uniref:DUF4928 family protein n=1 Tax=Wenzhouxiangella sp. EGI_FJ10305 TaxID=3243768 RepID=UPI0035DD8809
MPGDDLKSALYTFAKKEKFRGKGPLSIALVITQHAKKNGLPLDPETLVTDGGGQVRGLGKNAVQSVLERHGEYRVLASEGGRTSRGSLGKMRAYVAFLNTLEEKIALDLDIVEDFWIKQVKEFFAGHPFKIKLDSSRGLRTVVHHVIDQAVERQKESGGTYYAGAVLQHMVGAKLDCALGEGNFQHNSFATADAPGGRAGDFVVGDVAIHVTTSPGEAVIGRCNDNLNDGYQPVLVTMDRGLLVAQELAKQRGIDDRIDIFEIEQFVALNLYEIGRFDGDGRRTAVMDLVKRYNEIIEEFETDPSIKIELKR